LLEDEANFTSLTKKIQSLKRAKDSNFMDINPQKETWSNFKKLTVYISIAVILVLVSMAFFLL